MIGIKHCDKRELEFNRDKKKNDFFLYSERKFYIIMLCFYHDGFFAF